MENLKQLFGAKTNAAKTFSVQGLVTALENNIAAAGSTLRIQPAMAERVSNEDFGATDVTDSIENVFEALGRELTNLSFENFNEARKADARVSKKT